MTQSLPIQVLHFISGLWLGGAQTQLYYTLRDLNRDRFQCRVLVRELGGEEAQMVRDLGVEVHELGEEFNFYNRRTLPRLIHFLRQNPVTILHNWIFQTNCLGAIAGSLSFVPAIVSGVHNVTEIMDMENAAAWEQLCIRFSSFLNDRITVPSERLARNFASWSMFSPKRIVVVHNGVDLSLFDSSKNGSKIRRELGIPAEAALVGLIGRISPEKDIPCFLRAASVICRNIPDVWFLIVGEGRQSLFEDLQKMAGALGLQPRLVWTGKRNDIEEVLAALDLLLLTSVIEGFPVVLLEAMAMGKAAIATDVGGNADLIVDGVTGFLAPPRDPDAVAAKAILLLRNPEMSQAMGKEARMRVETRFHIRDTVKCLEKLYYDVLGMPL